MKKLIFTIGTVLLSFSSAVAETNDNQSSTQKEFVTVGDSTNVKLEGLCTTEDVSATEQLISEDSKIIESQMETVAPLLPGKSAQEIMADDNKIIEGANTGEVYPLDFKKINQDKKALKLDNKRLIGSL